MAGERSHPYAWWGPPQWPSPEPMTLPQLIQAGDLDLPLAAFLWSLMERRASLIVGAMPRLAGKTTILTALLDLLRPEIRRIYTRGLAEDFDFVGTSDPSTSYLVVNELSDHLPYYLWGAPARRALELLPRGYGLAATMHADTPQLVVGMLEGELGVSRSVLGQLTAVVNLEMRPPPGGSYGEPLHRVRALTLIEPKGGELDFKCLVSWEPEGDSFLFASDAVKALAARSGVDGDWLSSDLAARRDFLSAALEKELMDAETFRQAVLAYYESR